MLVTEPDPERHCAQSQADSSERTANQTNRVSPIPWCGIERDSSHQPNPLLSHPNLTVISRNMLPPTPTCVVAGCSLHPAAPCPLSTADRTVRCAAWLSRSQNLDHTIGPYRSVAACCVLCAACHGPRSTVHGPWTWGYGCDVSVSCMYDVDREVQVP